MQFDISLSLYFHFQKKILWIFAQLQISQFLFLIKTCTDITFMEKTHQANQMSVLNNLRTI